MAGGKEESFVIDAGPMGGGTSGAGRYSFRLIDELLKLEPEIPLEIVVPPANHRVWNVGDWSDQNNVTLRFADITGLGPKRELYYARNREQSRAHHSLSSYVPLVLDSDLTLVTIHDLKEFQLPGDLDGKGPLKRWYVKRLLARSIRCADHVITVSEHTKSDILRQFDVDECDVTAIPLGPGSARQPVTADLPVDPPYILFVGAVRPHKNVATLVEGFQAYRRQTDEPVSLVIAGNPEPGHLAELEGVVSERFREDVHFLGHVDEDVVASLYDAADLFVFPSLYEGFGLPPLEAMSYGTPVVASNRASIPEVVGEAAVLFEATDPADLADAITTVLNDVERRNRLIERGHDRVRQFSWRRTAEETLEVYKRFWFP